jgi:alpha-amylase
MTPLVSFYFQVHQPYRLRDVRFTEIGRDGIRYFDEEKNRAVFRKVAQKCYLPTNRLLQELLEREPGFTVSFSLSGVFLEQCLEYGMDVLESFRALAATGRVEFLAETSHHSLSYLWSLEEFCSQVQAHVAQIEELFGQTPRLFRNTELVYSNELAQVAHLLGFQGILAEGADHLLRGRSPNVPYEPPSFDLPEHLQETLRRYSLVEDQESRMHHQASSIAVLLKNYRLSDDVAFRFSDRSWVGFPLTAETYADWIAASGGHCVNLYMDYETFGEHQWEDTGIFEFLRALPGALRERGISTVTPSGALRAWGNQPLDTYDAHTFISWADIERDLSAWRGNQIQEAAFQGIYALEEAVKSAEDPTLLEDWRRLQSSDHFYYMCTKYWSDGDVHKYFNPYESPYEAYRRYSHILHDLRARLERVKNQEGTLTS